MNLPDLKEANFEGKRVFVRADLDVDVIEGKISGEKRLEVLLPTLNLIFEKGARKIIVVGHRGRPDNGVDDSLKIAPLLPFFKEKYSPDIDLFDFFPRQNLNQLEGLVERSESRIIFLENLRFWPEEEGNDESFAEELAFAGDAYVNEAFAASHRNHASIISLPKKIKQVKNGECYLGPRFKSEIENLSQVLENPRQPVITYLSGVKKDKVDYIESFKKFSNKIYVSGRLPEYLPEDLVDPKIEVAKLNPDKEDITIHSIEHFEAASSQAGTIIVSGPMGKFEDLGHRLGTQRVFESIAKSNAYKLAGGGDTEVAISTLNLESKFDWISIGGGAMLEFLANGTLPGIEALLN